MVCRGQVGVHVGPWGQVRGDIPQATWEVFCPEEKGTFPFQLGSCADGPRMA